MIKAVIIINIHGLPRLTKFYEHYSESDQQKIVKEISQMVSSRDDDVCNFLESGSLIDHSDFKLIYRQYATLYFVFCVDTSESELGILDLMQVFVESLDKCFENVCELDLIFHVDKIHHILNEIVMGGLVLDTNMADIAFAYKQQNKIEKRENGIKGASVELTSRITSHLAHSFKDVKLPDISKIPDLPNMRKVRF